MLGSLWVGSKKGFQNHNYRKQTSIIGNEILETIVLLGPRWAEGWNYQQVLPYTTASRFENAGTRYWLVHGSHNYCGVTWCCRPWDGVPNLYPAKPCLWERRGATASYQRRMNKHLLLIEAAHQRFLMLDALCLSRRPHGHETIFGRTLKLIPLFWWLIRN